MHEDVKESREQKKRLSILVEVEEQLKANPAEIFREDFFFISTLRKAF